MFAKNEGPADRTIRVVAGILLIAVGLLPLEGLEASIPGIVAVAFGLWLIVTGAIGVCPLYVPFGINTLPKRDVTAVH
jgi:uncharacterized membrane protein HdeD (DUF308 family)